LSRVYSLGVDPKDKLIDTPAVKSPLEKPSSKGIVILGRTEKLAVEVAVWMPIIIIFIFSSVGVIYANQK